MIEILNEIEVGEEFYITKSFSLQFNVGYAQFGGTVRGRNGLMPLIMKIRKVSNDEYVKVFDYFNEDELTSI